MRAYIFNELTLFIVAGNVIPLFFLLLFSRNINTLAKEQLSPEFMKINPQHTVPTLDDNGKILWDSHAICTYLITKYGKDDSLYPKDAFERAQVDQRMHFDSGVLFPRFRNLFMSFGKADLAKEAMDNLVEALKLLETFLGDNKYLVGNTLTLADFSCGVLVSTLVRLDSFRENDFPKLFAWIQRLEQIPYYKEVNHGPIEKGLKLISELKAKAEEEADKAAISQ